MPPFTYRAPAGGGGGSATDDDWETVDITSADWTKTDPDGTATAISHTGGVNSATIDTTGNANYVDACVWHKELTSAVDGSSLDYTDKPVHFRGVITFPNTGYATSDGSTTGGNNNPPPGSRTYVLMGLTSDPANFPTPADIAGAGLESWTSTSRLYRALVRNTATGSPSGVINTNRTGLQNITEALVASGRKATNRVEFEFSILPQENLTANGIDVAGSPKTDKLHWRGRYDNGDAWGGVQTFALGQRWGRSTNGTTKLYVWVCVGRTAGSGSSRQVDWTAHYSLTGPLTSGTNPSGETPLS